MSDKDLEQYRDNGQARRWPKTPFPVNEEINRKVVLFDGDMELLRADAIVNPTNENLTQLELMSKLAGPELESHIKRKVKFCSTGDVRVTPGFNSNFKHIIHAVPPKYQVKYKTAAETALFHTYFRILEAMIEMKIRTVVMPILSTPKCNLPVDENCHMQLRVIRRMLEKKCKEFDVIVVQVDDIEKHSLNFYTYFPRSELDEEIACYHFEPTIGGPNGEPVIPGREIRIKGKPAMSECERSLDLTSGLGLSTVVGQNPFSKMQDDLDKRAPNSSSSPSNNQLVVRRSVFRGCNLF